MQRRLGADAPPILLSTNRCPLPACPQVAQLFACGLLCVRSWCAASGRAEDLPPFLMPNGRPKKAAGGEGGRLGKRRALEAGLAPGQLPG